MTFLLIIPAWLLLMSLVAALCMAARTGDDELREQSSFVAQAQSGPHGSKAHVVVASRPAGKKASARDRSGVGIAA